MKSGILRIAAASLMAAAVLAGPAGASTAKLPAGENTTKHETKVVIDGYDFPMGKARGDTPFPVRFKGHIECVSACLSGRKVTLKQTDVGVTAGTDKTNASGKWSVTFNGNEIPPGRFKAIADRSVILKKSKGEVVKRTVCKRGVGTFDVGAKRGY